MISSQRLLNHVFHFKRAVQYPLLLNLNNYPSCTPDKTSYVCCQKHKVLVLFESKWSSMAFFQTINRDEIIGQ